VQRKGRRMKALSGFLSKGKGNEGVVLAGSRGRQWGRLEKGKGRLNQRRGKLWLFGSVFG